MLFICPIYLTGGGSFYQIIHSFFRYDIETCLASIYKSISSTM
ncbi:MAG: hypothetical protein IJ356_04825 [Erysipelotrichaceae bacterium]|nr:hypothetical protein [Erysipelotrichaceae bacterium]